MFVRFCRKKRRREEREHGEVQIRYQIMKNCMFARNSGMEEEGKF
jgi:hypothetical protein